MKVMLLVCPSCRTRYVVPDSAIGSAGRQVRCASCRHSWFQDGPATVAPPPIEPVVPTPAPTAAETTLPQSFEVAPPPPPPMIDPVVREEAQAAPVMAPPPADDYPERSQFAHEPPFRPRRNPLKIMTWAAVAFAALVAIAGGALYYSGWLEGSFASGRAEPKLEIVLHDNLTRGRAPDGSSYFIASGSIVNATASAQNVPDMLVTLKDASGRPVYNWQMKPPVRSLGPGATADFSQLRRDVPLAASRIVIHWAL